MEYVLHRRFVNAITGILELIAALLSVTLLVIMVPLMNQTSVHVMRGGLGSYAMSQTVLRVVVTVIVLMLKFVNATLVITALILLTVNAICLTVRHIILNA